MLVGPTDVVSPRRVGTVPVGTVPVGTVPDGTVPGVRVGGAPGARVLGTGGPVRRSVCRRCGSL